MDCWFGVSVILVMILLAAKHTAMQNLDSASADQIDFDGSERPSTNIDNGSRSNSTENLDEENIRARRPRGPTTTEDPLLDATLDPRLENDVFNLYDIMMLNDYLGASVLAGLELQQMSRMANIPLPHERIGPAPPLPPVPSGPAPSSASGPNLLPLYLQILNSQTRPSLYGYHSGEGGRSGIYGGGDSRGDDPAGTNCVLDAIESSICQKQITVVTLLSFPEYLLAVDRDTVYRIAYNGTPLDEESLGLATGRFGFDKKIPSASLVTSTNLYMFFGYKYTTMNPVFLKIHGNSSAEDSIIASAARMFREAKLPIKGVMKTYDDSAVFFSDKSFITYHPKNSTITMGIPRFRPLSDIPGAPERIDAAFTTDLNESFIYRKGLLYQLQLPDLRVTKKYPFHSSTPSSTNTWLKCKETVCA
ncbi:uncharacterized protein LOC129593575 [Paramacrobiotus metropolitanus]|uniref:uncharacterized protein LOC129593575 n=1 Tax=Paramacrobiotus metropolitanus TaxID=2943436 RepID=UPI0024458B36|nr:uncharacterized protein LOC129593575 [Paramacrobiotus metropolitanus]